MVVDPDARRVLAVELNRCLFPSQCGATAARDTGILASAWRCLRAVAVPAASRHRVPALLVWSSY